MVVALLLQFCSIDAYTRFTSRWKQFLPKKSSKTTALFYKFIFTYFSFLY
uniref:Uncharacterized protein n=1 Tax=Heterorhabditis bacteriophora TaxID=37862 RepID=A0A1I7WLQ9_HETBA